MSTTEQTTQQYRIAAIDAAVRQFLNGYLGEADPGLPGDVRFRDGHVAGILAAVEGVLYANPQCETCGDAHSTYEHEWVFTFGSQHLHPVTNEALLWCYTVVRGTEVSAFDQIHRVFGARGSRYGAGGFARQYESREAAGVVKYGLSEVTPTGRANPDGAS